MNCFRVNFDKVTAPRYRFAVGVASLALASCDDAGGDPANADRRRSRSASHPAISLAADPDCGPVSWGNDTPKVPAGLQVHALATGFQHPRSLYVLPNGDVLVIESNGPKAPVFRPKDLITGVVQRLPEQRRATRAVSRSCAIANDDSAPELRTVFLGHLNSPFGVALIGHNLYVANTDAIVRYPYEDGQTSITAEGTKLTDLPGGPIDHHWTKALLASQDGTKLYVGVGSNSNVAENGMEAERERAAIWEVDVTTGAHRIYASGVRNPTGMQWQPETGKLWAIANERDEIGPDLVPDYLTSDEGRRLLWLALQLLMASILTLASCRNGPTLFRKRSNPTTR